MIGGGAWGTALVRSVEMVCWGRLLSWGFLKQEMKRMCAWVGDSLRTDGP